MFVLLGVTPCFDTAGVRRYAWKRSIRKVRGPILRRYLQLAPGARALIAVDPSASLEEFNLVAAKYPVFLIRPDSARTSE
jgi:hypothetical protein